ncbi:MAG: ribonuclease BN [Bradyrhizobiaceae bacterium PARB1]|nr:MAG: ribonuclease BN [Bradyrhizobiaceae bacterium PARB1]
MRRQRRAERPWLRLSGLIPGFGHSRVTRASPPIPVARAAAAGVVFYGLLALFPAITALVSSYALFADPATINDHLAALADILPAGAYSIVEDQIQRVLAKGEVKLGFAFAISLGLAVWSANSGMKAVIDALNVVYDEKEERGFIKLNAVSLAFTLCALLAVLCAIGLVVAVPIVLSAIGLGGLSEIILNYGRWPVLAIMILLGLATLYRFGPSRRSPRWRLISAGGMLATLAWLAGSSALSYYLAHYAGYDATYGSLGAAIELMMWMWMSTIVILFGAELNAEIERETVKDSTDGAPRLLGTGGVDVTKSVETN